MPAGRVDVSDVHVFRRLVPTVAGFAVAAAAGTLLTAASAAPAAAAGHHPLPQTRATSSTALADPPANVAPSPDYWPTCQTYGASSGTCFNAVLAAIDHARSLEGVGPMVLPGGFSALTVAQQTFVVSNLERVDRGLAPALGMVDALNAASVTAAANDADPTLPGLPWVDGSFTGWGYGSNWAGDLNALAADYDWMYNDGYTPGGPNYNIDCQTAGASGCWGHRDNILGTFGHPDEQVVTGVASTYQSANRWQSIAQIFVAGLGSTPAFTTSWAQVQGTSTSGTVANPSTVSATSPDATAVSVAAPSSTTAGQPVGVTGHVVDSTTGAHVGAASVELCRHTVVSTTTTCAAYTTDATGAVHATVTPTLSTVYWWRYAGTSGHAAASSAQTLVRVRPRVSLSTSHTSTGWRVSSHVTPVRGQVLRLQRHTSSGWVTVHRVTARSWLTFTGLRSGTYRVLLTAVPGELAASARIRAA